MKRSAFSLVELILSIALLGIIMAAVSTLFIIGVKNYQIESMRNVMQKEINFSADDIGAQIKQAAAAPESYDTYTRSGNVLILALPAIDAEEDFIYSGENLIKDYFIYYLNAGRLYKKVVTDDTSTREDKEEPILENVSNFNCSYSPSSNTELVSCIVETSRTINNITFNFEATKTSRLRNHR